MNRRQFMQAGSGLALMAAASGAQGLEAVVVLTDTPVLAEGDLSVVRDFAGSGVPVHLAAPDGTVVASLTS